MISGHGANPIFFNKEMKIGRPEHSFTPHPPTSDNTSFLLYFPPPTLSRSGRHMCITPKCGSLLVNTGELTCMLKSNIYY